MNVNILISSCLSLLTASASGPAPKTAEVYLNCSTPIGANSEVTIQREGQSLILSELSTAGALSKRVLSEAEWSSGTIKLRAEEFTQATLTREENGEWAVWVRSAGSQSMAWAECDSHPGRR